MLVEVKVPSVGESIKEGMIHAWKFKSGDDVKRDQVLLELETDKATVEVFAEQSGRIEILKKAGDVVAVGDVIAKLDTSIVAAESAPKKETPAPSESTPVASSETILSPAARKISEEKKLDPAKIKATGKDGRVTKEDAVNAAETSSQEPPQPKIAMATKPPAEVKVKTPQGSRSERREPMSMIRRRTAERLIQAQTQAAILTTFNEIDMSQLMQLRTKYKEKFKEKYDVNLGFMSFFTKAVIEGLKSFPALNAWIEGKEIVYHDYYDIGMAVSSDRGLMVPVVRDAEHLSIAELESAISQFAKKARDGKISIDDLSGGTFTLSNGGVFGSLMSTPILNPPQSGILGLHKIEDRPVVVNGQIVIKPMMYVALSYDHRIVDGRESVQFLVKVKECIEDPSRILLSI